MTRSEKIAELRAFDSKGKNRAVQNHIAKLEAMTDEAFPAHLRKLEEMKASFVRSGTVDRLAAELARKS